MSKAAARRAPETTSAATPAFLFVTDPSAVPHNPKRRHEILADDGQPVNYDFEHGKKLKVPYAHAMRFLRAGFRVEHEDGTVVPPIADPKAGRDEAPKLERDQVIARMDELTTIALVQRANMLQGGEGFTEESGRARLVAFLSGKLKPLPAGAKAKKTGPAAAETEAAGDGTVAEDINDPEALDKLFGKDDE